MPKKEPLKGTYCLLIHLKQDSKITIGKLGEKNFQKGYYIYVGSALNSLKTRIQRHLRKEKKIHWHIDYLLNKHTSRLPIKFSKKFFKFKNPNFLQTLLYIIYITRMTHCLAYSKLHLNP